MYRRPLPLRKNRGERANFFKSIRQAPVLLKNDKNRLCFIFLLIQSFDTFLWSSEYEKEIVELTKAACKQAFLFPPHPRTPGGSGRACSQVIHVIAPCTVRVYPKVYLYLTSSSGTLQSDDGNATKALGVISKTTILHLHHAFCTFLCRHCTTATWKCLFSRCTEEVHKRRPNFLSPSKLRYGS